MKKTAIWLVAAALLAACERDLPTTGQVPEPGSRKINAEQAEPAQLAIDDALARIVPELSFQAETGPLASSLSTLRETLQEGTIDEDALTRAMAEVGRYARATRADREELDAVRLALAVVTD